MKTIISLILLIFASTFSFAQIDVESIDWDNDAIGYACSVGGTPTKPVWRSIKLIKKKRYKLIREQLYSSKPSDQFLAVLILEQFDKKGVMKIKEEDKEQLILIRNSKTIVPVCSGCTYWDEVTLNELLSKENNHEIYLDGIRWFDYYYNKT